MPFTEKNLRATSVQKEYARTPTKRAYTTKKDLLENISIERNAKNQAYYWIISSGNLKRFADFCKKHTATLDYHGACVAELYLKTITNQI